MISIILTWVVITFFSYAIGRSVILLLYRGKQENVLNSLDISILTGVCFETLYAQTFSIFAGVGVWAFVGLLIIVIVASIYLVKRKDFLKISLSVKIVFRIVVASVLVVIALAYSNMMPQHYDTYLYHAQAIHWIEDYGVVPGLGNLHFRLAYNSAFMSLQALFSFKWLFGQSLHTVNGLITVWMIFYSVFSSFLDSKLKCSDVMKVFGLIYVVYDGTHISSPNTDTFALLLVYYIFVKWMELAEKKVSGYRPYALLCVLAVFATTLKLSAGIVVLLVFYPLIKMIREKRVSSIFRHLGIGFVLLLPYFLRSFLISGYFLYPYEASGFIETDWKMPTGILDSDRDMIIAWGRGNNDVGRNGEHIWQWIGEWFAGIGLWWQILLVLSLISIAVIIIFGIIRKDFRGNLAKYSLYWGMVMGLGFWLLTAPLPRYGAIYMLGFVAVLIREVLVEVVKSERILSLIWKIGLCSITVGYFGIFVVYGYINSVPLSISFLQSDYANNPTRSIEKNGIVFYVPIESDQTGYEPFPTTLNYREDEITVGLRGSKLGDGFRTEKGE